MAEHMITLCGQVANVYLQPGGTSKKTGEVFDPRDKVQVMGELPLSGGGFKLELVTLNVDNGKEYQALVGKKIRVPVGAYSIGKTVGFYILQGAKPLLVQPSHP